MTNATISFRATETKRQVLDDLAASQQRDRSFIINEALDYYIELRRWQLEHIQVGIEQHRNGEVISHEEVMAKMDKMRAELTVGAKS